jgi:hypothetical protein
MRTLAVALCIASADAFAASCANAARGGGVAVARAAVCAVAPLPPQGFVWADEADDVTVIPSSSLSSKAVEGVVVPTPQQQAKEATKAKEAVAEPVGDSGMIYCNDSGCWIGEPPPVKLPDGREIAKCDDFAVELGAVVPAKRKPAAVGPFAPVVTGAKAVMGEKELNKLRGDVIAAHSKVISAFVDTSESPFGQIVLSKMFEAADKDGNGSLDREEIKEALHALGFKFIKDKQLDIIFERADDNDDLVIDFEEFVKESPKTLRSSLIKLAKQNGHDLGFLA